MAYKIINNTGKFKEPSTASQFLGSFSQHAIVAFAGSKTNDGWVKVQDLNEAGAVWIREEDAKEVPNSDLPGPSPLDPQGFVVTCLVAERILNGIPTTEPFFVHADFVIARALVETGMNNVNVPVARSDGVGPLRVTSQEWARFLLTAPDEFKAGYVAADRLHPTAQVRGATWTMHVDVKEISKLWDEKEIAAGRRTAADVAKDPFIPSYLDVFIAYLAGNNNLTGNPAAAVALRTALEADPQQTVEAVLNGILPADKAKAMFADRKGFEGVAQPAVVGKFVDEAKTVLNKALKDAFDLIKKHSPEDLPQVSAAGAPWLIVAADAMNRGVSEATHINEIISYFDATDHGPASATTPWCGAFAAHCMKNSGNPTVAASIPKGAAGSANWANWGAALPRGQVNIPKGAIVVLSKSPETGASGHVGFFLEFIDGGKKVRLLGGNQSQKVTETPFDASRIAAIRWLDVPVAQPIAPFNLPAGIPADRHQHADLIVRLFAEAGLGKVHQIAALANAIKESTLDPNAEGDNGESFGLFQCRRIKGVGKNYTPAQLKDPTFNTQLIIAEAKKYSLFVNATTLRNAVYEFVLNVERPKNPGAAAAERFALAETL